MAGSKTTVLFMIWIGLLSIAVRESHAATNQLIYRFTIRSFLPAGCHRSFAALNSSWDYQRVGGSGGVYPNTQTAAKSYVGNFQGMLTTSKNGTKMCPIFVDIANKKFNGHPDFEVADSNVYAEGCTGNNFNLTSGTNGGVSCNTLPENITTIVDPDMEYHEDGLPKPKYCTKKEFANDARCGWNFPHSTASTIRASTTGPDNFKTWYRDSPEFNMRSGVKLPLGSIGKSQFQYSTQFFFPLATNFPDSLNPPLKPCLALPNRTMDCSNGGRYFPLAQKIGADEDATQVFTFTSEHHSFFQYKGTENFTFEGDDDVWVYINERLAVDDGGLHSRQIATINLAKTFVAASLGLVVGETYALDIFHAERHTHQSTFTITTGLTGGCNVLQSGKTAYSWTPATLAQDWKLVGGPTWGIVQGATIKLTDAQVQQTVGYAFLQQQVNVGTGFVISFNFSATTKGEGFVFVIQRDRIIDLNGGSGGNLGFRNTLNSVGIVFDFCVDRDVNPLNPACAQKELRMHYIPTGGANNATNATKILRAPLYFPVVPNDGQVHTVVVNYFAQSPPWMEVLMDDDLLLQKRGINLDQVIGGRNAFVGFSGSTGITAGTTTISDFFVSAVAIEDPVTQAIGIPGPADPPLNATADNRKVVAVNLKNLDFCNNSIQFGGFGQRAKGQLTLVELAQNTTSAQTRRMLADNTTANTTGYIGMTVNADIIDTQNGQYTLQFKTLVPGTYDMQVWYGEACFSNKTNTGDVVTNPPTACFTANSSRSVVFSPVPPVPPPPQENNADGLPQAAITGIGVAAGIVGAVGSLLVVVGLRMRKKWRRDKAFIDAGKAAVAERGVEYLGDHDLDVLQNRLQQTLAALQAERAKKLREGDKQAIIDELNRQRGELQEQVRRLKVKMNGGDPNAPEEIQGLGFNRIRKSFAASRVSRGISMRMSRGFSLAAAGHQELVSGDPAGTEMSTANPLFQRMSQAFTRKKPTPPVLPDI